MICNGFNSSEYRYFRNKQTGEITKFSKEDLRKCIFNSNFKMFIESAEAFEIIDYPDDLPFDIIEFIKKQNQIVFRNNWYRDIHFDKNDILLVNDWLKSKLESEFVVHRSPFVSFSTSNEYNNKQMDLLESDEFLDMSQLQLFNSQQLMTISNDLSPSTIHNAIHL